jgi:hypothetical protein
VQYAQDPGGVRLHRNLETVLLPLNVDETPLSDAYPVPKMGGAITVADSERGVVFCAPAGAT